MLPVPGLVLNDPRGLKYQIQYRGSMAIPFENPSPPEGTNGLTELTPKKLMMSGPNGELCIDDVCLTKDDIKQLKK